MAESGAAAQPNAVVGAAKFRLLRALGPGLVTGAADDDPSGIAAYTQAGPPPSATPSPGRCCSPTR